MKESAHMEAFSFFNMFITGLELDRSLIPECFDTMSQPLNPKFKPLGYELTMYTNSQQNASSVF